MSERALTFARRFTQTLPREMAPQRLVIESAAPEHCGFGTGTQLGLSVARALSVVAGMPELDTADLARRTGRGLRSALGIHGFARGGFLVEAGKREDDELSPLVARLPLPEPWRVVVAVPLAEGAVHGEREREAFRRLPGGPDALAVTDALCRLVLLGMLPALLERDLEAFGEPLFDFNARVGEAFAPVQGGTYASRRVAEVVGFVRGQGVRGVGQSSWGPAVFAVVGDKGRAHDLARCLRQQFALDEDRVFVTRACNRGAEVSTAGGT